MDRKIKAGQHEVDQMEAKLDQYTKELSMEYHHIESFKKQLPVNQDKLLCVALLKDSIAHSDALAKEVVKYKAKLYDARVKVIR